MAARKATPRSGREVAARALTSAAARFPDVPPMTLDTSGLIPAEAGLAVAIHRTTLRRWLTLEHVVGRFVGKPMWRLEPAMRAVLLSGATQLLFMERLPAYAVVDEMVALARRLVRPKAAAMVNGVLRNVSRLIERHATDEPWQPDAAHLPWFAATHADDETGDAAGSVLLKQTLLPEPTDLSAHLALACSMPEPIVRAWLAAFGEARTIELCVHGLKVAPTIVAVEDGFDANRAMDLNARKPHDSDRTTSDADADADAGSADASASALLPHAQPGFVVWRDSHEALTAFLSQHPHRRVQDPASAQPITATRDLRFTTALDYCAGRGTKTRQLAAMHPNARIIATDVNADRLDELAAASADLPNIEIMPIDQARHERVDLLLLDVPCSNTAVLARRPEARYRLTRKAMHKLLELQRRIVRDALPTLDAADSPAHVLYSTCSLDEAENQQQARWLAKQLAGRIVHEGQMHPAGSGTTYHDGSYHALLATDASPDRGFA